MSDPDDRAQFLNLAGLFEGGMVFVAVGLAWLFGVDILSTFRPEALSAFIGLGAALPPFVVLLAADWVKVGALERIKRTIEDTLGPSLVACRWYDLILLAAIVGLGEELLFRGVMQPLFERWMASALLGLIASNVVFGLLHAITPTYAVLAGLMGIYFGVLSQVTGQRNLLAPILAHGLYDYLAFLLVIREFRSRRTCVDAADDSHPEPRAADDSTGPSQPV